MQCYIYMTCMTSFPVTCTTTLLMFPWNAFLAHYSGCGCRFLHLLGTFPCTETDGDSCDGTTLTNVNRRDYFHDFNSHFRHHVLRQCYDQSNLVFNYVVEVSSSIQRYSRSLVRPLEKTPLTDHSICNYNSLRRKSDVSTQESSVILRSTLIILLIRLLHSFFFLLLASFIKIATETASENKLVQSVPCTKMYLPHRTIYPILFPIKRN